MLYNGLYYGLLPLFLRSLFFSLVLCLLILRSSFAQDNSVDSSAISPDYTITLKIRGLQVEQGGEVNAALFVFDDTDTEFEFNAENVFRSIKQDLKMRTTEITFTKIPSGRYVAAVLHDVNKNGMIDYNFFKIPTEGVGFSSNPLILFGAPKFSSAEFEVVDRDIDLSIDMIYFGT